MSDALLVQDSDYASHPLWGSCMGSTLKFCNLEALRALEEGKSGSDRLLCVEKIGQNVFVIRMVRASGMAEGEQDVRKGTRADALSAIALWMGRFECTYVEWAPKNIITASLPDLSELLVSPRDGAVSSLTSRRRQAVPLSPASSDAHSPCSSRSSMPNGSDFSYEAVANDLLSLTTPREAISI